MKKMIRLLVICLAIGVGGFYLWRTQLVNSLGFSNTVSINQTSTQEQTKLSSIRSQTVLLQNLTTGDILIEKNKEKQVEIASLTKLITAYLLLEFETDLTRKTTINQRIIDELITEGASLSGYKGEDEITIQDLSYGIVLPSGGDAALTAANYVSGNEKDFVVKMNEMAEEMGMSNTQFKNPTGLDAKNHYSTVEDLNKFMSIALKNTHFRELVTTTSYQTEATLYTPEGYYLESTMLKDSSDLSVSNGRILGGKTGYTKKAGQCLISLAEVNGEDYLLITTGADGGPFTEQFNMLDARQIYEAVGSNEKR